MARPKGSPKYGGRKKGTPNAVTKDLRERIAGFLTDNWEEAVASWSKIDDPKDKLKLYIDLANFGIPKLQAVSLEATVKKEDSVEEDLRCLCEENKE